MPVWAANTSSMRPADTSSASGWPASSSTAAGPIVYQAFTTESQRRFAGTSPRQTSGSRLAARASTVTSGTTWGGIVNSSGIDASWPGIVYMLATSKRIRMATTSAATQPAAGSGCQWSATSKSSHKAVAAITKARPRADSATRSRGVSGTARRWSASWRSCCWVRSSGFTDPLVHRPRAPRC